MAPQQDMVDYPVLWEGSQFRAIDKFDCRVIELSHELDGCSRYTTVIPISPKEHREQERQTKAHVVVIESMYWTLFKIYSDWGECHEMYIHNSLFKEIELAKKHAWEQGLLFF